MPTPERPVTLIVFARRPRAGRVKRRLARAVGARRAAALYAQTLAATLAAAARVRGVRRVLMPATRRDLAWFRRRYAARGWRLRAQAGGDLGTRMQHALEAEMTHGRAALLLGSDLLDVTSADLAAARDALAAGAPAVLGPAADGGYWLIGLTRRCPRAFLGMPWGTGTVLERTLATLREAGLEPALLPLRHDLDHARDLPGRGWHQRRRTCSRSRRAT